MFPNLEIDDKFTLAPPSSPIMDDIVLLPTNVTLNAVRQKYIFFQWLRFWVSGDNLCLHLLECYMRIYFKYRASFKRGNMTACRNVLNLWAAILYILVISPLYQSTTWSPTRNYLLHQQVSIRLFPLLIFIKVVVLFLRPRQGHYVHVTRNGITKIFPLRHGLLPWKKSLRLWKWTASSLPSWFTIIVPIHVSSRSIEFPWDVIYSDVVRRQWRVCRPVAIANDEREYVPL